MSDTIENQISKLLSELKDPNLVADEFLRKWERNEFSYYELNCVGQFFINAGLQQTLAAQIIKNLQQSKRIPWIAFSNLISTFSSGLNKEVFDQIFTGATEENAIEELIYTPKLDEKDIRFKNIRTKILNEKISELKKKNLEIPTTHTNISPPSNLTAIKINISSTPLDSLKNLRRILEQKEIEYVHPQIEIKQEKPDPTTVNAFIQASIQNPNEAYYHAIALYQMECYSEALQSLNFAPDSPAKDWLRIEILFEDRKFLEVIAELNLIEIKYVDNPDTIFHSISYKAKALWKLNEKESAIQLLESILKYRPNSPAIQALLNNWKLGL